MPRPLRPIGDWLIYDVVNRGNARRAVSVGQRNYPALLRALAADPAVRRRRWAAHVQQRPPDAEVTSIRSSQTGLPYGDSQWVTRLAKKLHLDLTVRPRGRPQKHAKQT